MVMRKMMATALMVIAGATGASAQNSYLVTTARPQEDTAQNSTAKASPEALFISNNFRYYSLCDWMPGMKFMVIPERMDLIVSTFKLAATGKDVDSGELKHKIMEYQGVDVTERGFLHFNFLCDSIEYYCEIKNTTLADYCSNPKKGIKTLAYLGDVDIANALLVGQTLYTRCDTYYQDDANSTNGCREVKLPINTPVTVTAVGVGSRAFPVKIVFEDAKGTAYYKEVAISKTNSGMLDSEFIMNKADRLFTKAFGFTDPNQSRKEQLLAQYNGKMLYLKHASEMTYDSEERTMKRYTQYTVRNIDVINGTNHILLHLSDKKGEIYTKRVTLVREDVTGDAHQSENYFNEVFGIGNLRKLYPAISESIWSKIESSEVGLGMNMTEVRLAVGEPMRTYKDPHTGHQDWIYENRTIISFKAGKVVAIK